ncbi:hypothetical protein [Aeromonas dhakensis]
MRTDNDVSGIKGSKNKRAVGINRCLSLMGLDNSPDFPPTMTSQEILDSGIWHSTSEIINKNGIYLSKIDLENDLAMELEKELLSFSEKTTVIDAVSYLQNKKAIRMREFLSQHKTKLASIKTGELAKPLLHAIKLVVN